jgi:hypothetical protein
VYWTQEKKPVRLRKAPGGLPLDIRQNTDGSYDRVKQVTAHEMRPAAVVGKCDFATGVQGRRPITQKALEFRECLLLWAIDV